MPPRNILTTQDYPETRALFSLFAEEKDLDLAGTAPVVIRQMRTRFELSVDGIKIGAVQSRHHRDEEYSLDAELNTHVPPHIHEAVFARLRPLAAYVQRSLDACVREERALMDEMMAMIGPVDSPRVKAGYAGDLQNINALLFPGIAEKVLGPRFRLDVSELKYGTYEISGTYGEGEMRHTAFRVNTGNTFTRDEIQILGRGNREKARHFFVSEALNNALRATEALANDPDLIAAARALTPEVGMKIDRAAPQMGEPLVNAFRNPERQNGMSPAFRTRESFSKTEISLGVRVQSQGQDRVIVPFGEGFSATLRQDHYNRDTLTIRYRDDLLFSEQASGFVPGIPVDVAATLWFGAQFVLGEHDPAHAKGAPWTGITRAAKENVDLRSPRERVAAAFEM